MHDDFIVKLKVEGTGYRGNHLAHITLLKPRALHPKRPSVQIDVDEDDDFYTALLPDDSWEADNDNNEYEVEKILDLRWSNRTRTSKKVRGYLIKWKGHDEPEWLPMSQLSFGALLYDLNPGANAWACFQAMQAGDDRLRVWPQVEILERNEPSPE
ncbi:hypothetical protein PF010_g18661 [Phytophthora fragariae]|uniref:Chromo domain-containing protein n=1 Tax=Phytophthora fragariae TaxID=53985 RepID=A0A6G0KK48_9STRA|nr:hypothetical protein PF010_g18661 [Phytophthora fragariae]